MIQKTLVVGPFQCNCMLFACEKTKEAILVDPGDEPNRILEEIGFSGFKIKYLLHTHGHLDHIAGTAKVREKVQAPVCVHKDDHFIFQQLPMQGRLFGLEYEPAPLVEHFLVDSERLRFGEMELEVLHTPGHSPGSVCFRLIDNGSETLLSGDTLFKQSVGRSDLWGGDHHTLVKSIKERLFVLDDDLQVFPGHGPSTTIGLERRTNPFLI